MQRELDATVVTQARSIGPRLTLDSHRINRLRSKLMVDLINNHGGNAEYVDLLAMGSTGTPIFIMQDLNNLQAANLLSDFLHRNGLDGSLNRS